MADQFWQPFWNNVERSREDERYQNVLQRQNKIDQQASEQQGFENALSVQKYQDNLFASQQERQSEQQKQLQQVPVVAQRILAIKDPNMKAAAYNAALDMYGLRGRQEVPQQWGPEAEQFVQAYAANAEQEQPEYQIINGQYVPKQPGQNAMPIPGFVPEEKTPLVQVNTGDQPILTPGQEKVDEGFATDYREWRTQGGFADIEKQIRQLNEVITDLERGKGLTGPIPGMLPESAQKIIYPKAVATREAVEEVVQRNLRLVLGAQFTEKEGERLIARAYNPALGEKENIKRVKRLINQIKTAARAKESAARYYEKKGTLQGYTGKNPSLGDFYEAVGEPVAGDAEVLSDEELLRQLGVK